MTLHYSFLGRIKNKQTKKTKKNNKKQTNKQQKTPPNIPGVETVLKVLQQSIHLAFSFQKSVKNWLQEFQISWKSVTLSEG